MSADRFWLTEDQFARLAPLSPDDARRVPRAEDRRVISGIVHVLRSDRRWEGAPACCEPHKTLCDRFVRWAAKGVLEDAFARLAANGGPPAALTIDATRVKAHRSAAGGAKAIRTSSSRPNPPDAGAEAQAIGRSCGGGEPPRSTRPWRLEGGRDG